MTVSPDILQIVPDRRTRPRDVPLSCRKRLCTPAPGSRTCPSCERIFFKDDVQVKILPAEVRL